MEVTRRKRFVFFFENKWEMWQNSNRSKTNSKRCMWRPYLHRVFLNFRFYIRPQWPHYLDKNRLFLDILLKKIVNKCFFLCIVLIAFVGCPWQKYSIWKSDWIIFQKLVKLNFEKVTYAESPQRIFTFFIFGGLCYISSLRILFRIQHKYIVVNTY